MKSPDLFNLACRYARALDSRDAMLLSELFHPEAELLGRDLSFHGLQEILELPARLARWESTMHMVGNVTLLNRDESSASGETYCVAYHVRRRTDAPSSVYALAIRYQDTLVKHEGRWVFRRRELRRVWTRTFDQDAEIP